MDQAYKEIAPRLRALREAVGYGVEEMARLTDTPEENVRLYESGEAEIPVSFLFKVAQACKVDLTVLISGGDAHLKSFSLVRAGKGLSVDRRKDYDYKSLAFPFAGRKMEPFLIAVPPKEEAQLSFATHPGQEFIHMLEGKLEITIDGQKVVLGPGDSLYFDSTHPHALRGLDGAEAKFIDVII